MRLFFLTGTRPMFAGTRRRGLFGIRYALAAVVVGAALAITTSLAFANVPPVLTPTQATFTIPGGSTATWTLNLWSGGKLLGTATGTTGTLTVPVPGGTNCHLQTDVRRGGAFYAGVAKVFTSCGPSTPTTTSTTSTTVPPTTTTSSPPTSPTSSPPTVPGPGSSHGVTTRPASSLALTGPGSGLRWLLGVGVALLTSGLLGLICLGPLSAVGRRLRGAAPPSGDAG